MEWSGEQKGQLQQALLSAFPTQAALKQMIREEWNENLEVIAGGNDLSEVVFNVMTWAEARGKLEELARKACRTNPDNPKLQRFVREHFDLPEVAGPEREESARSAAVRDTREGGSATQPEQARTERPGTGESTPQGGWQTAAGRLTAIAAVVLAVGGLIAVLRHLPGSPGAGKPPAPERPGIVATRGRAGSQEAAGPGRNGSGHDAAHTAADSPVPPDNRTRQTLTLPAGMEVKLNAGKTVFKILAARLEPYNAENRSLTFRLRCTNNDRFDANFWSRSFRLLVEDVPREPDNFLDELVGAHSAREGDVVFTVPVTVSRVVFQLGDPNHEVTKIPFDLKTAGP